MGKKMTAQMLLWFAKDGTTKTQTQDINGTQKLTSRNREPNVQGEKKVVEKERPMLHTRQGDQEGVKSNLTIHGAF